MTELKVGDTLGSYRIVQKLGEGGMGAVYLAEHVLLGKRAAIKVLLPGVCNDSEIVQRFFNEARAATLLQHPGVIEVFDFGHPPGSSAYIVMEFLDGESLAAHIRREPRLRWDLAVEIARQIAGALSAAHERGIVHRDLKPDNVFLVSDRDLPFGVRVKVLDFGIAKLVGAESPGLKTRTGALMGTPAYMSPEQCRGAGAVDHRTDIYALGCVLFEMVAGKPPFVAEGVGDVIAMHLTAEIPLLDSSVPPPLVAIVRRALAKRPEERFADMKEMMAQLEAIGLFRPLSAAPLTSPTMANLPTKFGRGPSTTLSHAVGQIEAVQSPASARSHRLALPLVAALFLVVGGAAGGYALWSRRPGNPSAEATAAPGIVIARPALVTFRIESEPGGADVYGAEDGLALGKTPFEESVAQSPAMAGFILKLDHFLVERVELSAARDEERRVILRPVPPVALQPIAIHSHTKKPTTEGPRAKTRPPERKFKVYDPFAN